MALQRGPRSRVGTNDDPGDYGGTPPDLLRAFVDEVTWFMSENKISRADLAQSLGVSPGRVSQILSGDENLTLRTLSSVAAALGAEIELALHAIEGEEG
ncbi:MAG: helix-turn-helix transcriptional regulator [Trebonia sp.]